MEALLIHVRRVFAVWRLNGDLDTVQHPQDFRKTCNSLELLKRLLLTGGMPVESDEFRSLLDQHPRHVGHASRHRRLADADHIPHASLERPGGVESQRSQNLNFRTDGSGPLRPST